MDKRSETDLSVTKPSGLEQSFGPGFPQIRMRRTRAASWCRNLVSENSLSANDLIWPIFIAEGDNASEPIAAMPGVFRLSIDRASLAAKAARDLGIPALALFPNTDPARRSDKGDEALNPDNLICRAIREIKSACPEIGLVCDVALDPYTSHGHDGLIIDGEIANDETLDVLVAQALNQARAGADILAPSDMMDGRIGAIRYALESEGFKNTLILSYAAKYASCFYGPFRDAVGSSSTLKGDKRTYQMDPANSDEALREVALDIAEGADMVMVKPGLPYLDIIFRVREQFAVPTFAYQVSGEYSMIATASDAGILDRDKAMMESLIAFKRAGATGIFTYFAQDVARRLNG